MSLATQTGFRFPNPAMSGALARNWWAIALRGVFAILFGLVALTSPLATVQAIAVLFALYMLADGLFAMIAGVRAASMHQRWGLLALEGAVNLAAGAAALAWPSLTVLFFLTLLGLWSVFTGLLLAVAALRLHASHGRIWLLLAGIVSIIWGVVITLSPITGAIVVSWWLGGYALVFGAVLLAVALRLRPHRAA